MLKDINRLIQFALENGLLEESDVVYAGNRLIDLLGQETFFYSPSSTKDASASPILDMLLDEAWKRGILEHNSTEYRDLLDTRIMDCLMPRPSEVNQRFAAFYTEHPKKATDWYYKFSKDSNYIRTARVAKDLRWKVETDYGELDLTINLSKPEKDPKLIARAKNMPASLYPSCLLCCENVGYAGHLNHPARQNHRIIPLTLQDENWYLQYSPYVYYNEHCIVLKETHEPMQISQKTFDRLLDFTSHFKHYFIGSNADLPIVGGSILSHDHFQGGSYAFAMEKAPPVKTYCIKGFEGVGVEFLKWPLSVLRLKGPDPSLLSKLGSKIFDSWRVYNDPTLNLKSFSGLTPHHTVTPIARFRVGNYELDLVLRDNQVSDLHPDGIFHPHAHLHHLKKENIGLIEVMGLAVLPGRLKDELSHIKRALVEKTPGYLESQGLEKHKDWLLELMGKYPQADEETAQSILETEVGKKFVDILSCCGVFKQDKPGFAGMDRFVAFINDNSL